MLKRTFIEVKREGLGWRERGEEAKESIMD